jgi:hypothetical protein
VLQSLFIKFSFAPEVVKGLVSRDVLQQSIPLMSSRAVPDHFSFLEKKTPRSTRDRFGALVSVNNTKESEADLYASYTSLHYTKDFLLKCLSKSTMFQCCNITGKVYFTSNNTNEACLTGDNETSNVCGNFWVITGPGYQQYKQYQ